MSSTAAVSPPNTLRAVVFARPLARPRAFLCRCAECVQMQALELRMLWRQLITSVEGGQGMHAVIR